MKAFSIIVAILFAWVSGVGSSSAADYRVIGARAKATSQSLGALLFLMLSIVAGIWAWKL